jgi:hypothetical protein
MHDRTEVRATSQGDIAADILRQISTVEVAAVFERAVYLLTDRGLIALCVENVGRGPINVTIAGRVEAWRDGLNVEAKGRVETRLVVFDDGPAISLAQAPVWLPPAFPVWPSEALVANLSVFMPIAAEACSVEGLAALVFAPQRKLTHTTAAARETLTLLRMELPACLTTMTWTDAATSAATLLVGLGPGATPSGDDVLGGLMLALTARGAEDLRDALWEGIVDELGDLTVPISAMHLAAAADGQGAEAMHEVMNTLLSPGANPATIARTLDAIGATSGWDAAAGFVAGVSA